MNSMQRLRMGLLLTNIKLGNLTLDAWNGGKSDPDPDNWFKMNGTPVHKDEHGKIDGGAGGKFNGKKVHGIKGKEKTFSQKKGDFWEESGTKVSTLKGKEGISTSEKKEEVKSKTTKEFTKAEMAERAREFREAEKKCRNFTKEKTLTSKHKQASIYFGVGEYGDKNSAYNKWESKLTPQQKDAIETYTSSAYREINGALRGQKKLTKKDKEQIKQIDESLKEFELKDPLYVVRGGGSGLVERAKSAKDGLLIEDGFLSSSPTAGYNGERLELVIPPGIGHGAWIDPLSVHKGEDEFLVPRGAILKICKIEENKFPPRVKAILVGFSPKEI